MNSRNANDTNPYFTGLRAMQIVSTVNQILAENPSDSEDWLKAQQARALVWVATQLFEGTPHPAVQSSALFFEPSGSMSGPELSDDERKAFGVRLIEQAEQLIADYTPRPKRPVIDFTSMQQTPEDADKAVRFAQELLDGSYRGTRYIFLFTDGDSRQ
jgi:hypothetical protein